MIVLDTVNFKNQDGGFGISDNNFKTLTYWTHSNPIPFFYIYFILSFAKKTNEILNPLKRQKTTNLSKLIWYLTDYDIRNALNIWQPNS